MVETLLESKALVLQLDGGIVDGKQRLINRTFSNVKETATDEKLKESAEILMGLQERDLLKVRKREMTSIF